MSIKRLKIESSNSICQCFFPHAALPNHLIKLFSYSLCEWFENGHIIKTFLYPPVHCFCILSEWWLLGFLSLPMKLQRTRYFFLFYYNYKKNYAQKSPQDGYILLLLKLNIIEKDKNKGKCFKIEESMYKAILLCNNRKIYK